MAPVVAAERLGPLPVLPGQPRTAALLTTLRQALPLSVPAVPRRGELRAGLTERGHQRGPRARRGRRFAAHPAPARGGGAAEDGVPAAGRVSPRALGFAGGAAQNAPRAARRGRLAAAANLRHRG